MSEIKITCAEEQALNIYDKECLKGGVCSHNLDCDTCEYCTLNIDFDITDGKNDEK